MRADVIVFRPDDLRERATYESPSEPASGMRFVIVNGVVSIAEGAYTGAMAGRALRRQGSRVQP